MKPDTRIMLFFLGKIAISITLLYYAFSLINFSSLLLILSTIKAGYFITAILINFIGTVLLKSILIWRLLNTDPPTRLLKLISINLAIRFYTIFLPRAVSTGIRWHRYKAISDGHASFILLSFDTILTLTILSGGAIFWLGISGNIFNTHITYALSASTAFFAVILLCFFNEHLMKLSSDIIKYILPFKAIIRLVEKLKNTVTEFNLFDKAIIAETTVISLFSYLFFLFSAYLVAIAINIDLDFSVIAWIRSLVLLLALIPITIAGLGVRELSFIALLNQYDISSDLALSYAMASFIVQLVIGLAGSIIEGRNWISKISD